jgi:hypothetical protein
MIRVPSCILNTTTTISAESNEASLSLEVDTTANCAVLDLVRYP